jgi:hypothetical protein
MLVSLKQVAELLCALVFLAATGEKPLKRDIIIIEGEVRKINHSEMGVVREFPIW